MLYKAHESGLFRDTCFLKDSDATNMSGSSRIAMMSCCRWKQLTVYAAAVVKHTHQCSNNMNPETSDRIGKHWQGTFYSTSTFHNLSTFC